MDRDEFAVANGRGGPCDLAALPPFLGLSLIASEHDTRHRNAASADRLSSLHHVLVTEVDGGAVGHSTKAVVSSLRSGSTTQRLGLPVRAARNDLAGGGQSFDACGKLVNERPQLAVALFALGRNAAASVFACRSSRSQEAGRDGATYAMRRTKGRGGLSSLLKVRKTADVGGLSCRVCRSSAIPR